MMSIWSLSISSNNAIPYPSGRVAAILPITRMPAKSIDTCTPLRSHSSRIQTGSVMIRSPYLASCICERTAWIDEATPIGFVPELSLSHFVFVVVVNHRRLR